METTESTGQLSQRIMDAQGYVVVGLRFHVEIGFVLDGLANRNGEQIEAKAVVVGVATLDEFLAQANRFSPDVRWSRDRIASQYTMYAKVVAE